MKKIAETLDGKKEREITTKPIKIIDKHRIKVTEELKENENR